MTERIGYINRSNNKLWLHKRYDSELDDYAYASDFIDYHNPPNGNVRRIFSFSTGKSIIYNADEEFKVIDDTYSKREVVKTWSEMYDEYRQVFRIDSDVKSPTKFSGTYVNSNQDFRSDYFCYQSWDGRIYEARLVDYDWDKLYPWENHFGLLVRSSGALKVATVLNVFDHNKKAIRVNVNFMEGFFIYKDGKGSKIVPELEYLNEFGEKWYLTIQDSAFVASSKQGESKNPIQTLRYATWQKVDEKFSTSTIKTAQASKLPLAKGLADESHKDWCEDQFFKVLRPQHFVIVHKSETGKHLFASSDFKYRNPGDKIFLTAPVFVENPNEMGPVRYHHTEFLVEKDPIEHLYNGGVDNLLYKDGEGKQAVRIPMGVGSDDFSYKGWDNRTYKARTVRFDLFEADKGGTEREYIVTHQAVGKTDFHSGTFMNMFSWDDREKSFGYTFDVLKGVFYKGRDFGNPLLGMYYLDASKSKVKGEIVKEGILFSKAENPWNKEYRPMLGYTTRNGKYNARFIPFIYSIIRST